MEINMIDGSIRVANKRVEKINKKSCESQTRQNKEKEATRLRARVGAINHKVNCNEIK